MSDDHRPIFILGCQRSGTTLLGLMVHSHPNIVVPPENRFVLPLYFKREQFGDLNDRNNRRRLATQIVDSRRDMRNFGLDRDTTADRIVRNSSTLGSAYGTVFRSYAEQFGKPRWGNKLPQYQRHIWVVQRLFPTAQFIHLVRDGRDCVGSLKNMEWWNRRGKGTYHAIQTWMEATENAAWAHNELGPDTFYELQYEHLVTDPEAELRKLCRFIGEPFDEGMLHPEHVSRQVVPDYKTHHAKTRQEVSSNNIGSFANTLEPWELSLCEAVMGDRLRHYGYELSGASPPETSHLDGYRHVESEERRRLEKKQQEDLARADTHPLADLTTTELQQRQINSLKRRVRSLTKERNRLRSRLDRTLTSRSWRWTRPLRVISATVAHWRSTS